MRLIFVYMFYTIANGADGVNPHFYLFFVRFSRPDVPINQRAYCATVTFRGEYLRSAFNIFSSGSNRMTFLDFSSEYRMP